MVEIYLKDSVTQHPGGWEDIINYVNEHYDRYKATYKVVDASVEKIVNYAKAGTPSTSSLYYNAQERREELPKLESIKHPVSGITASLGWIILKELGLPTPGHKDWLKPCSKWRVNEKV